MAVGVHSFDDQLSGVKEDLQNQQQMLIDSSPGSMDNETPKSETPGIPTIEETLDVIQKRLSEKRRECNRPEDLSVRNAFGFPSFQALVNHSLSSLA